MRSTRSLWMTMTVSGVLAIALLTGGCSRDAMLGTAAGAAATGGVYEYQNKRAMERIEDDYRRGRISRGEYERRRQEIKDRSVIY